MEFFVLVLEGVTSGGSLVEGVSGTLEKIRETRERSSELLSVS
jgi:hypothetical protein